MPGHAAIKVGFLSEGFSLKYTSMFPFSAEKQFSMF
jgi:hypothetical protein